MSKIWLRRSCVIGAWPLLVASALAQTPQLINYQGRLLDGTNLVNGPASIRFNIYTSEVAVLQVYQSTAQVTVVDGLYSARIGEFETLGSLAGTLTNSQLWLELVVNGTILSPRERITSAAYSLLAGSVATGAVGNAQIAMNAGIDPTKLGSGSVNATELGHLDGVTLPVQSQFSAEAAARIGSDASLSNAVALRWSLSGNAGTTPGTHFLGTTDNQPVEMRANNLRALRIAPATGGANIVLGHDSNVISNDVSAAAILGGATNSIASGATNSVIAGGRRNSIGTNANDSVIGGGSRNAVRGRHTVVAGGDNNQASGLFAVIGGGNNQRSSGLRSVIAGGEANDALSDYAVIGGGSFNVAGATNNAIFSSSWATIAGGRQNTAVATHSTIAGGYQNYVGLTNSTGLAVDGMGAFIGGGDFNTAAASHAAIGGGATNVISAGADHSFIGAGTQNSIAPSSANSSIAGGFRHSIGRAAPYATIGGGGLNRIGGGGAGSVIAGGGAFGDGGFLNIDGNEILSSAAFIGGGWLNSIETNAGLSGIVGGQQNLIRTNAQASVIGGGSGNSVGANARYAVIPGGRQNAVGDAATNALAAGRRARASHRGVFVWADDTDAEFASTANNQFLIRASGGVGIGTTDPGAPVHVQRGASGGAVNSSATLALEHSTNSYIHMLSGTNAAQGVLFGTPGNEIESSIRFNNNRGRELTFRAGSNQVRMAILADGNVGIGTTAPDEKLEVNGNVLVNDFLMVRRTTAFPVGGSTITPQSGFVQLQPASNIVLNTTTSLASGQREGQVLILQGDSTYTTSILDASNVSLGAATRVLGFRDVLTLIWSGFEWIEMSFANN